MSDLTGATGQIPDPIGSTNRGNDTVFEGSQTTVTLEKINGAVMGYLKDSITPIIKDNDTAITVPILYGDGERWAQVRKEGYIRDPQSDKLLAPLIMLRRANVTPGNLNNPNNKYLYNTTEVGWNRRNVYDRFAVQNNIRPSRKIQNIMIPDYMDIDYEVVMWTELQAQMDSLIEQINVENYEFWGNRNNYKFRVTIDAFQTQNELPPTQDRIIRTQFNMKVAAYLVPERVVKNFKLSSSSHTGFTAKKIVVKETMVDRIEN